ncbi:zinc finger protein ZAT5-like [Phragmites australis]|uniref:zinc finger protein ZAT5-like n=1 Tax=Phragmites australis TaxID=29695 RepID=UPI002D7A3337|nr:zinc finger protein ZAT5-like [Phragmites australis]
MQAEVTHRESKPKLALMVPTSSTEHSGKVDRHQPLVGAGAVVKRKRTKRPRHHPPASSASSSESTTTEEEDMAHCLILLAQSGAGTQAAVDSRPPPATQPPAVLTVKQQAQPSLATAAAPAVVKSERYTSRKYTEAATTADGVKAGFYVYECKTCNKCFPTFQALGGHRASHKKPRVVGPDEENTIASNVITTTKQKPPIATASPLPPPPPPQVDVVAVFPDVTTALSLNNVIGAGSSSKLRVHECSICGAEFASGQALGGHMRRHRPLNAPERAVTAITTDTKKEASASINLELDLNLPAPSDEEAVSLPPPPPVVLGLGQFNDGKKAGLMLTASALVDCHY